MLFVIAKTLHVQYDYSPVDTASLHTYLSIIYTMATVSMKYEAFNKHLYYRHPNKSIWNCCRTWHLALKSRNSWMSRDSCLVVVALHH